MGSAFADNLARLRALVTAGRPLPADLGEWVVAEIEQHAAEIRRCLRDAHLRRAGELIGGTINARAREIAKLNSSLASARRRSESEQAFDPNNAISLLLAARERGRIPSIRRLRIILGKSRS